MRRLRVKEVAQAKGIGMAKLSRMADLSYRTVQSVWHNPQHDVSLAGSVHQRVCGCAGK